MAFSGLGRFDDRARKVVALANQEAQRFNHHYVGTEHILIGLTKEWSGVHAEVLTKLGLDWQGIRLAVKKLLTSGATMVTMGMLPKTENAHQVINFANEESRNLGHDYVGTEHLLIALMRNNGKAHEVLSGLGLTEEQVRNEVRNCLTHTSLANAETKDIIPTQTEPPALGAQHAAFAISMAPALHLEVTREKNGEIVCVLSDHKTPEDAERELRSFKDGDAVKLLDHVAFTVHPTGDNALIALIALCKSGDRFDPGSFHQMISGLVKFVFELGMKHGQQNRGE